MKLFVVSDCHIGLPDERNNDFKFDERAFIEFLRDKTERYDKVILNGDIFELNECEDDETPRDRFLKISNARGEFMRFLRQKIFEAKIVLIAGNHDGVILRDGLIQNVRAEYVVDQTYVAHGHAVDMFNADEAACGCFGRWTTRCVGDIERKYWADVDIWLSKLEPGSLWPRHTQETYERAVEAKCKQNGYKVVVLGHTHRALRVRLPCGAIYANSGKCRDYNRRVDAVVVDTAANTVEIVKATIHEVDELP